MNRLTNSRSGLALPSGLLGGVIGLSLIVNIIIAVACVYLAVTIVQLPVDAFGNLGKPVQFFVGGVVLIPVLVALFASWRLLQGRNGGRFAAMALYFVGSVLASLYLLHLWNAYRSYEQFVDTIMANSTLLFGLPLAYALYWVGGRFKEDSIWRGRLMAGAGLVAAGTFILLVLAGDVLGAINYILATYAQPVTWITTLAIVLLGFLSYQLLQHPDYFGQTTQEREAWQGWLMLAPNIIGFSLFFAGPLLLSFYLSFTNSTVGKVPEVINFENYTDILSLEFKTQTDLSANPQAVMSYEYTPLMTLEMTNSRLVIGAKDTMFWLSLRNTLMFCVLLVPLAVIPALLLSIILNSKLPGMKFFRAVYFLPSVAAVVGTALIWSWLYDPTIGFFNYTISSIVTWINTTFGGNLADPRIEWLTGPGVVLFSIVFLSAWQVIGYNTVLFLAGLQNIPLELYEAAMIDGANRWRQFRYVTLPMLAPTTFFVMITTVVTGLQVFNEPYALFPARPLPVNATTSVFYLYERGFFRFEFGYASSIAWLLFIIIFMITLVQFRLQRNSNAYS